MDKLQRYWVYLCEGGSDKENYIEVCTGKDVAALEDFTQQIADACQEAEKQALALLAENEQLRAKVNKVMDICNDSIKTLAKGGYTLGLSG